MSKTFRAAPEYLLNLTVEDLPSVEPWRQRHVVAALRAAQSRDGCAANDCHMPSGNSPKGFDTFTTLSSQKGKRWAKRKSHMSMRRRSKKVVEEAVRSYYEEQQDYMNWVAQEEDAINDMHESMYGDEYDLDYEDSNLHPSEFEDEDCSPDPFEYEPAYHDHDDTYDLDDIYDDALPLENTPRAKRERRALLFSQGASSDRVDALDALAEVKNIINLSLNMEPSLPGFQRLMQSLAEKTATLQQITEDANGKRDDYINAGSHYTFARPASSF